MKNQKLEKRLFFMKPLKNGFGRFIPYCNYSKHQGIVKHNHYKDCEKKNCNHYLRLYLTYKSS